MGFLPLNYQGKKKYGGSEVIAAIAAAQLSTKHSVG